MKVQPLIVTSLRERQAQCAVPSVDSQWLWGLTKLPVFAVALLAVLLVALPEVHVRLGQGDMAVSRMLLLLMVPGMAIFAFAIEMDIRLARYQGPQAADARTYLAFSTCFGMALFAVWVGIAAEKAKVRDIEPIVLVWLTVLAVCVPLLWFTARTLATASQRAMLLGGFIVVTVAVELSFDAVGGDVDERIFTWHSLLIALALALRLWTWGLIQFCKPSNEKH